MAGQLLVSGNPQNYSAIGEAGQPIYSVAFQLREAVRLKAGAEVANCLAIPQRNEQGNLIDWYAPERGDVVPWSAATAQEREHALIMLDATQSKLDEAVRQLENTEPRTEQAVREKKTVLPLLKKLFFFPDSNFIYLVNGKPVITFWGFNAQGATLPNDPFVSLRPVGAAATAVPVNVPTKRHAWWWWLLLLLLLLLLAVFALRSCGAPPWMLQAVPLLEHLQVSPQALPEQQVQGGGRVGVQTDVTSVVTNVGPNTNTGVSVPPVNVAPIGVGTERRDNVVAAPDNTNTSAISNTQDLTTTAPELPQRGGREAENTQTEPNTPAPQPDAASNTNTVTPSPNASGRGPNNQTTRPGTNDQSGNPMLIPDSALNSGSTRFLDGSWSAGAGIQDAATGKPVRLEYDFSQGNGQGRVTVRRGDGVQCTGSVGAQMQGRTVQINDRGTAKCTDGSTMALPKVTCTPGVGNQAACQGQYDNGTSFPVSMRHAPK